MVSTLLVSLLFYLLPAGTPASGQSQNLAQTRSPHGNLNVPCQNCHTSIGWKPIRAVPEFNHNKTSYPLRGMHENVACTQCHTKPVFTNVGTRCADCHADIHKRQMGSNCEQCHTVKGWDVSIQAIRNHENRFPLMGAHALLECDACHKGAAVGQFQGLSTQCYSCHAKEFQQTTNPNHAASQFSTGCEQCHGMNSWLNAKFDHAASGFPLSGAHANVACAQCHVNNNYNLTSANTACVSCHLKDFQGTTNPNHVSGNFSQTCQQCHNTVTWANATFDHSTTGFPLTGAHATVQCSQCHINGNYNLTSANTACVSCHLKDFQSTTNPNHVQQGFAQTCETCHNTTAWQPATFNHSASGFPLTGAHATTPCASCHVNNNYSLTSANTACVSCHQTDYNNAVTPINHIQLGFPNTCQNCHDTVVWTDGKFDHSTTGFTLTGAHTTLQCSQCHINNNYNLTSANTACVSCHLKDFQSTTNPNHVAQGFAQTCQVCHNTTAWSPATFDHSTTGFPLTGAHATTPCTQCHVNNNYNLTSANTACVSCHQTDYNNATTPINHIQLGFPTTCQNCHDTVLWTDGKFDHSTTGWPLTGFHLTSTQCVQCHVNNNYNLTSANTVCSSCHMNDYNTAVTPVNHIQAGFPTTCDVCHDTVLWTDGKFDHSTTGWPLTGAHLTLQCTQCHVNSNYKLSSTACSTCHMADYNGTNNPAHAAAGFPTTCDLCHDTTVWTDSTFNHNNTPFPLTGAHTTVPCASCHVNNNYTTLPTICSGCHMADYNSTNNPNHTAAAWPTTCNTCHTTTAWIPATLPSQYHTFFPVTHGNANGVCSTCHQNPNDFSVFQCTNCHTAAQTNPEHQGITGYVYNSVNCYNCHKNGGGG